VELGFELKTIYYDIIINYYLSQKPELGNGKFNYLTIIYRLEEREIMFGPT
jgi:hypothetical protein